MHARARWRGPPPGPWWWARRWTRGGAGCWCGLRVLQCSGRRRDLAGWAMPGAAAAAPCAEREQQGSSEHPFPGTHDSILSFLQITFAFLVRQLENHMHDRGRIDRLIAQRRLEADLVGSRDAASSRPCPRPRTTRFYVQLPVCHEHDFNNTSPSSLSSRASSCRPDWACTVISTGVVAGPVSSVRMLCRRHSGRPAGCRSQRFAPWPRPLLRPSPCPASAMPLPNPALATRALNSFGAARSVALSGALGQIKRTELAATRWAFGLPSPFKPLGSPKPPVCTFWIGAFTVGVAELPNSPVCTISAAALRP